MVSCEVSRTHRLATGHNHAKSCWGNSLLGAESLMTESSSNPPESLYVDKSKSALSCVLWKCKQVCNMNTSGGLLCMLTYKASIEGHVERYQHFIGPRLEETLPHGYHGNAERLLF